MLVYGLAKYYRVNADPTLSCKHPQILGKNWPIGNQILKYALSIISKQSDMFIILFLCWRPSSTSNGSKSKTAASGADKKDDDQIKGGRPSIIAE